VASDPTPEIVIASVTGRRLKKLKTNFKVYNLDKWTFSNQVPTWGEQVFLQLIFRHINDGFSSFNLTRLSEPQLPHECGHKLTNLFYNTNCSAEASELISWPNVNSFNELKLKFSKLILNFWVSVVITKIFFFKFMLEYMLRDV
jgi:hypothetical protein